MILTLSVLLAGSLVLNVMYARECRTWVALCRHHHEALLKAIDALAPSKATPAAPLEAEP